MKQEIDYLSVNKQLWNKRTEAHLSSDFYNVEGFLAGNTSLNDIELKLLGDIKGKSILHLQCHFGQDTISLKGWELWLRVLICQINQLKQPKNWQ